MLQITEIKIYRILFLTCRCWNCFVILAKFRWFNYKKWLLRLHLMFAIEAGGDIFVLDIDRFYPDLIIISLYFLINISLQPQILMEHYNVVFSRFRGYFVHINPEAEAQRSYDRHPLCLVIQSGMHVTLPHGYWERSKNPKILRKNNI